MSKPIIDFSATKNILQGAIGAIAFGAYHQFNVNKIMELNDYKHKVEINELHNKYRIEINEINLKHRVEMDLYRSEMECYKKEIQNLTKKIEKLERRWF
jgi:hypothetical protein